MRFWAWMLLLLMATWAGCGTTKWTDTARTATEQLLISDSMDRAVSRLDLRAVAGKKVFLDDAPIKGLTDAPYLVSTLRQHILASGAILKDARDQADYIVELRAGALGTDHHDLLFGVPALTIPTLVGMPTIPSQIPEIPLVKKTEQRAVAKVSVFAYNRQTGRPLWQSGAVGEESRAKAVWFFGAGPFQRGHIYDGTKFAGDRFSIPLIDPAVEPDRRRSGVSVADPAFFVEPAEELAQEAKKPESKDPAGQPKDQNAAAASGPPAAGVIPAGHTTSDKPPTNSAAQPATRPASQGAGPAGATAPQPGATPPSGAPTGTPAPPALAAPPSTSAADRPTTAPSGWKERSAPESEGVLRLPPISPFDDPPEGDSRE